MSTDRARYMGFLLSSSTRTETGRFHLLMNVIDRAFTLEDRHVEREAHRDWAGPGPPIVWGHPLDEENPKPKR